MVLRAMTIVKGGKWDANMLNLASWAQYPWAIHEPTTLYLYTYIGYYLPPMVLWVP